MLACVEKKRNFRTEHTCLGEEADMKKVDLATFPPSGIGNLRMGEKRRRTSETDESLSGFSMIHAIPKNQEAWSHTLEARILGEVTFLWPGRFGDSISG